MEENDLLSWRESGLETSKWLDIMRMNNGNDSDHTGKRVWETAVSRCAALVASKSFTERFVRGRRVLELGCGLGALSRVTHENLVE